MSILGYAQKNYSYWIQFSDKKGCGYDIRTPEFFLSKRSILRRQNQNIPIDSTDLPVSKSYVAAVLTCGPVSFLHGSRYLNGITVSIPAPDITESLDKIKRLPFVKNVECTFNPLKTRQHLLKLRKPVAARV